MYMNVEYVIATRSYEVLYIYVESHWKCHTFEEYIPVASVNLCTKHINSYMYENVASYSL